MEQAEAVRLVIWDLDETFWGGTLTEGGHRYSRASHDTVIELARRGIVSSICSKNDHATIERILRDEGIWDYFVFPSIDWSPKGPRVAAILAAVKLRAPTILFIDDNPMNLAEAAHTCPGIQLSDETIVPRLLSDPRLQGKHDPDLTRLAQYKVLEQKHQDEARAGGDNTAFLRGSNIRVFINHDVDANIDRAVELINRTNQLNFTKRRLSDDPAAAREELREELRGHLVNAGLVFATDRYGDYGCIGFYLFKRFSREGRILVHYCFSCRTLGMDIETWLYRKLGRPSVAIAGEVLTQIRRQDGVIDWITEVPTRDALQQDTAPGRKLARLVARGGCDVRAIIHYLENRFERVDEELVDVRNTLELRIDHSIFVRYATQGISADAIDALRPFGFRPDDFRSALGDLAPSCLNVVIASFWRDSSLRLYKDRQTGVLMPAILPGFKHNILKVTHSAEELAAMPDSVRKALAHLHARFDYHGYLDVAEYARIVSDLIAMLPERTLLLITQPPRFWIGGEGGRIELAREAVFAARNVELAAGHANVVLIDPADHVSDNSEYLGRYHFARTIYKRMAMAALAEIEAFTARWESVAVAEAAE